MIKMKKRLLILGLFILLLFPFSIKADTYKYTSKQITRSTLESFGLTWPTTSYRTGSSDSSVQHYTGGFWFHSINNEVSLCGGIGKATGAENSTMSIHDSIDTFKNASGQTLNDNQKKLLIDFLANTEHYTGTLAGLNSKADVLGMIANQIIAWEIIEGGRTSFKNNSGTPYAPTGYNGSDSAYNKVILPNSGSQSLFYYYKKALDTCYNATVQEPASFNNKNFKLKWDENKKRYETTVSNLGKYVNCTSKNSHINVSVSGTTATIYTTAAEASEITCKYTTGNGTLGQADKFTYYEFTESACANNNCQKIVKAQAIKTYTAKFTVEAESANIMIKKKNDKNEDLSGATFKITNKKTTSISATLTGNGSYKTIKRTGTYVVSETVVPTGYQKISDFEITLDASTQKITGCTASKKSDDLIASCMNGLVGVSYDLSEAPNVIIVLTIKNVSKNITIKKVNESNTEIKGATFRLKDKNNTDVKFKQGSSSNIYEYATDGTIVDINNANYSQYSLSLLPEGEYSLVETAVPYPYILPSKLEERTTKIKIDSNYNLYQYSDSEKKYQLVSNAVLTIKNYKSKATVIKTGDGKPLAGVKFKLFKEDKTTSVNSRYTSPGNYDYNQDQSGDEVTEYITNTSGKISFSNLPVGTYYLLETETIEPYTLPEGDAAYTKIVIDITKKGLSVNGSYIISEIEISNSKLSFNFYKVDEEGNYLKNGKFKIQKYDTEKEIYRDMKVKRVENDGTYNPDADIFEPSNDGEILFTLKNGIATFINMQPSSKYRIVEREAPSGYVRIVAADSPTVTIDEYGYSSGLLTLVNRKVSVMSGDAQAELIINISTGQQVIRYGLIIGGVIVATIVLIVFARKVDNKKDNKEEK